MSYCTNLKNQDARRLIEAENGIFKPCYCGSNTYLGDAGRGHDLVCCSKTMQNIEGCNKITRNL